MGKVKQYNYEMVIRTLFPGGDILKRTNEIEGIAKKNKGRKMTGKNQDYRAGYDIGEYLAASGEDLDIKDLDATAKELLEDLDYSELSVNNTEAFTEGLANGYIYTTMAEDEEDEET